MNKFVTIFIVVLFIINSCTSQSCNDLATQFESYQQANKEIKSANFKIEESINTSKSTFIEGATYYSCDSKTGFLFIEIRNTEYIHQNVPITLWESFKQADSFGRFYNKNFRGKYRMIVEN